MKANPSLNFIVGKNGQGKTSILEGLALLSRLYSFRTNQLKDVIQYGSSQAILNAELFLEESQSDWTENLKLSLEENQGRLKKAAWINDKSVKSTSEYLKTLQSSSHIGFHTITFNPSDHELFEGEPKGRRSYLNAVIAAEDFEYYAALKRFTSALEQRNKILKSRDPFAPIHPTLALLESFSEPMIHDGATLLQKRLLWLIRLAPLLQEKVKEIAAEHQKNVFLEYSSKLFEEPISIYGEGMELPSLETLKSVYRERWATLKDAEIFAQSTLLGPHRDDWVLRNEKSLLKGYASQGEMRTALLALKLSEIKLFEMTTGIKPVLLLDDFSSELDLERRELLLSYLLSLRLQAFVTTTEKLRINAPSFEVENGLLTN